MGIYKIKLADKGYYRWWKTQFLTDPIYCAQVWQFNHSDKAYKKINVAYNNVLVACSSSPLIT